ncbi:MAG: aldo/keto reductase [Planctomycetaceae bacterium]|nr:aldo/keto reductase [Planctomycetaceae bacterium]
MFHRTFGKNGPAVSEVGIGCWQIGGTEWGDVSDDQALDTLRAAVGAGITFIDTADIYGGGRSERLIGRFVKEQGAREKFFIASKLGRRSDPGWPDNFSPTTIRKHTEDSLQRLGVEALDLTQTHCLPLEKLKHHAVFETLADLQKSGKILRFGASVETIAEARECMDIPGLASLQIIFNIFRQQPITELFPLAVEKGIALIIRLPLASGMLAGKFNPQSAFAATDHRHFNRDGESFNVGETFSGVPWELGLQVVEEFRPLVPAGATMAQWALRWCLDHPAVTVVIPGAKHPEQARQNAASSDLTPLTKAVHQQLQETFERRIRPRIKGKV